jgi:hypothetical protein
VFLLIAILLSLSAIITIHHRFIIINHHTSSSSSSQSTTMIAGLIIIANASADRHNQRDELPCLAQPFQGSNRKSSRSPQGIDA